MIRVYRSLEELEGFGPCALTIGNFDGVHAGHQALIRRVCELAQANGWRAAAMTFDPHPTKLVAPDRAPKLLTSIEERIRLLEAAGMEQLLILPFTREVAGLSPAEFADRVLARLGPRAIVVGDNFRFGHKQLGDTRVLGELGETRGFRVEALEAVRLRGRVVSSTEVRVLVSTGDVARAARLLQRWFSLEGRVVTGRGVGAKQTVPTLNLATDAEVLPAHGVYVTRTRDLDDGREWASITNVGVRPTFGVEGLSVETFLLDPFDGVTPARIRVSFCHYIREERKFESPEALRSQILRDVARAQAWFRRRTRFRQLLREGAVR